MTLSEDEDFAKFLRSKAAEANVAVGYPAKKFHSMLNADGAFGTVKRLLSSAGFSDGFNELVLGNRADLTVEAAVVETHWRRFFSAQYIEIAEKRLRKVGYPFSHYLGTEHGLALKSGVSESASNTPPSRPLPFACADALAAGDWLVSEYEAQLTYESRKEGHQQGDNPLRIYTLPNGAQAAIRMNKSFATVYVRATSGGGSDIRPVLSAIAPIQKQYSGREDYEPPSSILSRAPYLKPSESNILVRLALGPGQFVEVFAAAFGRAGENSLGSSKSKDGRSGRPIDEEELRRRLERNGETGLAGEMAALRWEILRLSRLTPACPDPEKFVTRISAENVGAGYDIRSSWPGEERCIEVKATIGSSSVFFLSENERRVLSDLGPSAWIYRVELDGDNARVSEYRDPVSRFKDMMQPSAWRVRLAGDGG